MTLALAATGADADAVTLIFADLALLARDGFLDGFVLEDLAFGDLVFEDLDFDGFIRFTMQCLLGQELSRKRLARRN